MTGRWWNLRRRARQDDELDAELRSHLRMSEAERIARGESPAAAASSARREFGNLGLVAEITREMWGGAWLERLAQDLRYGIRMLKRSPGFSIVAILCLTLAIGANASVFSWIEGILLRPYPAVAGQDRLMVFSGTQRGESGHTGISWPDLQDLRRRATLFDAFIGDKITGTTLSIGERAERAPGSMVSANYFDALGVRPVLGRGFLPDEEVGRNAHPVVVISYQLWKERFNGDPNIIGKTQRLNGLPHTIVGVAPQGFNGTFVGYAMQFWVPLSMQETFDPSGYKLEDRGARWLEPFARLKRGVTREQAQLEMASIGKRLETEYPATNKGHGFSVLPLWRSPFNASSELLATLRVAMIVVLFVLLIACANVGNLLLVRSLARQQEMTVRLAVGAARARLVRQLLTEGLVLSAIAAAGGLLLARWSQNLLALFFPPRGGVVINLPAQVDGRVLALSAAACVAATLLFALVPALQTSNIDLASALKATSKGVMGGRRGRIRAGLVVVQVSLSFVLLVGAVLLIRSQQGIRSANPGFATQNELATGVELFGYDTAPAKQFQDELLRRLETLSGVQSVAYARIRPFSYRTYAVAPITVSGYQPPPDEQPTAEYDEVSPGFLATLRIPLVAGRDFNHFDDDKSTPVAVVNEKMAERYWPGHDAVGRRFELNGRTLQVVGVAKMAKYRTMLETPQPFFYVPLRQNFARQLSIQIRTTEPPATMARAVAREIHVLDANLAPSELLTMQEQIDRTTSAQRAAVTLLGVFGGLALLLAAIGLYGVMSYAVSQSARELGLRMALGAGAGNVLRLVMTQGLALTAVGIAIGAFAALGWTRLIGDLLFQVSPRDPLAFGSALAVMAAASFAACLIPAWRATRTDPVRALRE